MSQIYNHEVEEEDAGYSLPKILVAVLLLLVVGAGIYIYLQKKKLKTSVTYLLDEKSEIEKERNEMIEKYNLAIDDNEDLEGNLTDERDFIVSYRDSIKKVKNKDEKKISDYQKTISDLKNTSPLEFEEVLIPSTSPLDANIKSETIAFKDKKTEADPVIEKTTTSEEKTTATTTQEEKTTAIETTTAFNRVEIPPTYPGCSKGTPTQKKACFTKKIKRHLSRNFNTSIIENLNLSSGKKSIWINFDIDKFGNVVSVKARAPRTIASGARKTLENEAIRTIKKMPKMIAAKQNGSSVQISYSVPLTLIVP